MSKTLTLNSAALAFVPAGRSEPTIVETSYVDTAAIEADIRARLEAEYQERLEREVAVRLAEERRRFDETIKHCSAGFDGCVSQLRHEIQHNVVDLSIQLSEVIVRHHLPDRDMLREVIVKTLEPVSDLQGATVRVSSHDWNLFGEAIRGGDQFGVGGTVQFAEDPNLSPGDVVVESRNGIFDARLDERLKLLKESLHERSGRKSEQPAEL